MHVKHLIDKVLITLESGGATTLFILFSKDGTIHRKGDGSPDKTDLPMKMGISSLQHFNALMMTVNEDIFNYAGVINNPNRLGAESRLTIIFQGKDEISYSFRVVYGTQSEGPPRELVEILINAVKISESWYQEQLNLPVEEKKWWKVWK